MQNINRHHNKLVWAVAILIVLMLLFLVYRLTQNALLTTTTDQSEPNENINLFGTVLELKDTKVLTFGSKVLTLPDGWEITTAYQNTNDALFKCNSTSNTDCRIYSITNGSDTFYISTPAYVKDTSSNPVVDATTKSLVFAGESVEFNYEKLRLEKKTSDESGAESVAVTDESRYYQLYGCTKSNICLNSFGLSIASDNALQVSTFETLVSTLKVE